MLPHLANAGDPIDKCSVCFLEGILIRKEQIIATTLVDRQREMMALSALESLVAGAHDSYIPVIVDHDPRTPPIGRVADARLEAIEDGEYAVIATWEMYEDGDLITSDPNRCIPLRPYGDGTVEIRYDRTYRDADSQRIIAELSEQLGSTPVEEGKKALEPISVLIVGAGVAIGAIATGFLNALGADIYADVKRRLRQLSVPKRGERDEQLLRFEFAIVVGSNLINVDVIFTNPTDADVEHAMGRMLDQLDDDLSSRLPLDKRIRRLVYEAKDDTLSLKFGVQSDAVPVTPDRVNLARSQKTDADSATDPNDPGI